MSVAQVSGNEHMLPELEQGYSCAHGPLRTPFVLRGALCSSASPTMSGMSSPGNVLSGWMHEFI